MAATAGFKAFDQAKEDWTSYSERLTHYFIATGITDASKQRSTLLSVCGPETYRLRARNLPFAGQKLTVCSEV